MKIIIFILILFISSTSHGGVLCTQEFAEYSYRPMDEDIADISAADKLTKTVMFKFNLSAYSSAKTKTQLFNIYQLNRFHYVPYVNNADGELKIYFRIKPILTWNIYTQSTGITIVNDTDTEIIFQISYVDATSVFTSKIWVNDDDVVTVNTTVHSEIDAIYYPDVHTVYNFGGADFYSYTSGGTIIFDWIYSCWGVTHINELKTIMKSDGGCTLVNRHGNESDSYRKWLKLGFDNVKGTIESAIYTNAKPPETLPEYISGNHSASKDCEFIRRRGRYKKIRRK